MAKPQRVPLSDNLVTVTKGQAAPAAEPGRRDKPQPEQRVAMTFRIKADAYELLRRRAFEQRQPQQALVDLALERFLAESGS